MVFLEWSVQDYVKQDDQTQPTFEMTPGFKPLPYIGKQLIDKVQLNVRPCGLNRLVKDIFILIYICLDFIKGTSRNF